MNLSSSQSPEVKFEIGHVLFIDIVGYSKLLINQQSDQLETLKQIVRGTEQFSAAEAEGKLLRLPTGDGGALVFRNTPEAPVLCALEISLELKHHPELKVRMGIHSGPVNAITDLNEQANIAGAGINYAQRVMDCGDAGHILLSRHVAEDLEHYPRWQPHLHDLGQTMVKHGMIVSAVNLYTDEAGNPAVPERFRTIESAPAAAVQRTFGNKWLIPAGIAALLLVAGLPAYQLLRTQLHVESGAASTSSGQAPATPSPGSAARTDLAGAPPSVPNKSIAVLPFENLSSDKENAYFADGIQDEILTRLSKIADLKVISRTSTQKYKSAPENLREIGQQLGVANLLEGSVQKAGNAVHINVQLIKAATDAHLWAESYDRELQNIFGVEGEVAGTIAEQLNAKLTGAEQKALNDKPTQNSVAYDAYLRGISIEQSRTDDAAQREALANYTTAVRLDPKFALAWARLAVLRSTLYFQGVDPATNSATAVKEAADQALTLQPQLGEALVAQGVYRYRVLRDFRGALESYGEALKRLPNSALVLEQMAHVERRLGQWDAAEKSFRGAVELDPRNLDSLSNLAQVLEQLRKFPQAEATMHRILQISPDNEVVLANKAWVFQDEGRLDEAARMLAKVRENSPNVYVNVTKLLQLVLEHRFEEAIAFIQSSANRDFTDDPRTITYLGLCQGWAGRKDDARATFTRVVAVMKPTPQAVVPVDTRFLQSFLAWAYAGLGENAKALEQGKHAIADYKDDAESLPYVEQFLAIIEAGSGDLDSAIAAIPHLLEVPDGITRARLRLDPLWDPLRKDPRFQKLIGEPH